MQIYIEHSITDGVFDLNNSEDQHKVNSAIDDCKRFSAGTLYDFLYNPEIVDTEIETEVL